MIVASGMVSRGQAAYDGDGRRTPLDHVVSSVTVEVVYKRRGSSIWRGLP